MGGGPSGSAQPAYSCIVGGIDPGGGSCLKIHQQTTLNSSAPAVAAAEVMSQSLAGSPFGLDFNNTNDRERNVAMVDNTNKDFAMTDVNALDRVEVFNVARSAGDIQSLLADHPGAQCAIKPNTGRGYIEQNYSGDSPGTLHCWQVQENGVSFPKQYNSGVVMRSIADLKVIPGCGFDFCETRILVVAAATQAQVSAGEDYNQYYGYRPRD